MGLSQEEYCIVLYLLPVLNAKSYDGVRVLESQLGWTAPQMDESDLCQTDNERREGRVSSG